MQHSTTSHSSDLPIHFFTIVLNGMPFLEYHIEVFEKLNIPWHWHIVEGVAELKHDTAWSTASGGHIPHAVHKGGRSIDGTSEYIDDLQKKHPGKISVYRKPEGVFWDGKREMVNAPLSHISHEALLWQIDNDELWTAEQIHTMWKMFKDNPGKTAAWFWCDYFVGPNLVVSTKNCYAQNPKQEWLRAWRFQPGMFWASHEPPALAVKAADGNHYNVGLINPFLHAETEEAGLVFQHLSYVTEEQLRFKESYYGYKGAVDAWKNLQKVKRFPVLLREHFAWVKDSTLAEPADRFGIVPLMNFNPEKKSAENSEKLTALASSVLQTAPSSLFASEPTTISSGPAAQKSGKIVIDGVFFQLFQTGIARVWANILSEWAKTEFAKQIVVLDRNGTAPKFSGIHYRQVAPYGWGRAEHESALLEGICKEEGATLFVSTYYTTPITVPSLLMVHDMIPEVMGFDKGPDPQWKEKAHAINYASTFVCVSENTKRDLLQFYPHVAPEKAKVIYEGVNRALFYRAPNDEIMRFHHKLQIERPYFLLVGPARGYKNVEMFFEGLKKLSTQHGFEAVLVGGHISPAEVNELAATVGTKIHHVKLTDDELRAAYSGAVAFVFPSNYEGFGLPVLEAMACRCPVVTTRKSSLPEVAGDAALYVDNALQLASALCEVQKPDVQASFISAGLKNIERFSWEKMAKELADVCLRHSTGIANQQEMNHEHHRYHRP